MQTIHIEHASPQIHDLIDIDHGLELVVSNFDFLEGPIWNPADQSLIFSDILGNSIYQWQMGGTITKLRRNSYMANGNAFDRLGRVITCEHATSRLSRSDFINDYYEVLATHYQGKQLNSPNDVVVKRNGNIYFTDPTSGRSAGYGVPREPELDFSGVYQLEPNSMALTLLVKDFAKPNGLCFSADESQLYINDTIRQHIRVFDVKADGTLTNGRLFADLVGQYPGVADGMKVDQAGNVYSCGPGGIQIFAPDGSHLGIIMMPEHTANFVFGGHDNKSLFITASTSVYRIKVKVPGHSTVGNR